MAGEGACQNVRGEQGRADAVQQRTIFISYRRADSLREARALFERLSREFGHDKVFIDLAGIEPGEDFVTLLHELLANCAVLLVLMGPGWASGRRTDGTRRLEDPNDFVRIEIGAALKRGVRVIPVCFDGAEMPAEAELPEELRPLVRRQAVAMDFNRFESDIRPLIEGVRVVLEAPQPAAPPVQPHAPRAITAQQPRKARWGFALLAAVCALGLAAQAVAPRWFQGASIQEPVLQALSASQALAVSSGQAVQGSEAAFAELAAARATLEASLNTIRTTAPADAQEGMLDALLPIATRSLKGAQAIASQQQAIVDAEAAARQVRKLESDLLEQAEAVHALLLQRHASAAESSAMTQVVMLTQRIPRSVGGFVSNEGVSSEAVFLLGKDLNAFQQLVQALLAGDAEFRLPGVGNNAQLRDAIQRLQQQFETVRSHCRVVLGSLQGVVTAREAHQQIVVDSASLRTGLEQLRTAAEASPRGRFWAGVFAAGLLAGAAGWFGAFGALGTRFRPPTQAPKS